MNYEKILKDALNSKATPFEVSSWIEEQFPELAKSEDEKIRHYLMNFVKINDGVNLPPDYAKKALAWLERQGEHANFRDKIQVGDKVTRNEYGALVNLSQLKRVAKPSEKQGEQEKDILEDAILDGNEDGLIAETIKYKKEKQGEKKPVIEMKTAAESLGIDSDTYNKIVDECIFGGQKPADTVEPKFKVGDKIYLKPEYRMPNDDTPIANTVKEIRRIDDKHYRFDGSYIFIEDQDKYELVEQKPEENKGNIGGISSNWSEEDEKNLRRAIRATKVVYPVAADWLRSLQDRVQPQNKWKPSELQLGCLSDAIEHYNSFGYPAPKLKELLDDLKKLKGKV